MKHVLEVRNVSYIYKSKYQLVHALNGASCTFSTGKFHVIEGKSGSGKTTLLSLLAGLDIPTEGQIYLDDRSYDELDREKLRREQIGIVFQAFNLFPLLTVEENVMYPARLLGRKRRQAQKEAREILEQVGLGKEYYRRLPAMLSGGEQQRVAIARALISGARLILADEPTGNLDSENGQAIVEIMKSMVKNGYGVIVVTHDHTIAEQADVVYNMRDGKIVSREEREEYEK